MTSLLRLSAASVSPTAILWAGTVTSTLVAICYLNTTSKTSLLEDNASTPKHAKLDVDLMDKIAEKPYLPVTKKRSVPRRLRILVIDVPEMRNEGIDGECRVNLSRVYVDGVAPPKKISGTTEVMQKSLARALVKCRHAKTHRIGVEMIEASISDLNPHNLRRTYQFGSYKYDPGKWATKTTTSDKSIVSEEPATGAEVKEKVGKKDDTNTDTTSIEMAEAKPATSIVKKDGEDGGGSVLASVEDEYDAPWNQYAWIQELQLRIGGRVQFGAPMEPAWRWDRLLWGSVYKTTIPSSRKAWEWLLLPVFQREPAGKDSPSCSNNWASNKPHAVIADGAAMQRVPGSLKFLQRTCQDEKVPLYIIHDNRVWGGNTHQDLQEALSDMRSTIKRNIVTQAMQGGSGFRQGRLLGQAETEARWQAKDMGRRTRQAIRDANEKLKRERENDWSKLTADELQAKLVERGVIALHDQNKAGKDKKAEPVLPTYTNGMVNLSLQCLAHEELRLKQAEEEYNAESKEKGEPIAA